MGGQVDIKGQLRKRGVVGVVRDGLGNPLYFQDMDGNRIDVATATFSQMVVDLDPAEFIGLPLICSDRHSNTSLTGGSLWTGSATGFFQLLSNPLVFANITDFPAAASYPGLRCHSTVTGGDYCSDGAYYRTPSEILFTVNPAKTVMVIEANTGISWTAADNGSGKVRLQSSAGHGLTASPAVGCVMYCTTTQNGWTAGTFHEIAAYVDSTHIDLTTAWASQGVPLFALANTEVPIDTLQIPAGMTPTGAIRIEATFSASQTGSTKKVGVRHGAVGSGLSGVAYWLTTAVAAINYQIRSAAVLIQNRNSVSSQVGAMHPQNAAATGTNSSAGGLPTGSINTNTTITELTFTIKPSAANEPLWREMYSVFLRT